MDPILKKRIKGLKPLPFKAKALGFIAMLIIRGVGSTMRFKIDDPDEFINRPAGEGVIWALWHNRIFALPLIYKRLMRHIRGVVLTSPSRDGDYLAALALALGVCSVRGSSSKKGGRALVALTDWLNEGFVLGITPDGPRGPRYKMAPGLIKLSQLTQSPIVTLQIDYDSYWSVYKSWDRFRIPKPFTTIRLTIKETAPIDPDLDEDGFEQARLKIESLLNPTNETD